MSVFFHRMGTAQSEDREVFAIPDQPLRNPYAHVTDDGHWLVISIAEGTLENAVWVLDLTQRGARPRPLFDAWDARYDFIHNVDSLFYFRTTQGAPRGRLIAIAADASPPFDLQQVIPETDSVLESVSAVGGHFIVRYLFGATSRVEIWHPGGRKIRQLELPSLGTAAGFPDDWEKNETFLAFETFTARHWRWQW